MKTEHSNESPFQKGVKEDKASLQFDVGEYAVIQVALFHLIDNLEKQIASHNAGDNRLMALGFTAENLKASKRILGRAKSAFQKFEMNGIGLTGEMLKNWENEAGERVLERLNEKLRDK